MLNKRTLPASSLAAIFVAILGLWWAGLLLRDMAMDLSHRETSFASSLDVMKSKITDKPFFADGSKAAFIRFAHIGNVSAKGRKYIVVEVRTIVLGMSSPRGIGWLDFFDERLNWISREYCSRGFFETAVCEGSCVYMREKYHNTNAGEVDGGVVDGNTLDVSRGLEAAMFIDRDYPFSHSLPSDVGQPKWR